MLYLKATKRWHLFRRIRNQLLTKIKRSFDDWVVLASLFYCEQFLRSPTWRSISKSNDKTVFSISSSIFRYNMSISFFNAPVVRRPESNSRLCTDSHTSRATNLLLNIMQKIASVALAITHNFLLQLMYKEYSVFSAHCCL